MLGGHGTRTARVRRPPVINLAVIPTIVDSSPPANNNDCLETQMKHHVPGTALIALAIVASAAIADEIQMPLAPRDESASSVHVQPRGKHFVPHSSEDDDIQRRITTFNSAQKILDAAFDKKLMICRRC
jgi:hypothetical protein